MDPVDLRAQLLKLREELTQAKHMDPESKQLLADIVEDMKRIAEPAETSSPAAPTKPRPSLSERLKKVAVQFEADHPTLAESTLRLVDLLGKAGL